MSDLTRRTGDELPPERDRTAADAPDIGTGTGTGTGTGIGTGTGPSGSGDGTRAFGRREPAPGTGGTAPGTGGEEPRSAAQPQPAGARATGGDPTGTPGAADTVATGDMPVGHEPRHDGTGTGIGSRLLSHDDTDKLAAQLQHAVAGFVDAPRDAVEEADHVLQEITARFADAVTERRRTLRRSWQAAGAGGAAAATDTEQLRLALRDYRELAERLLQV
ncbi:hypothetical protein ACFYOV_02310 [Streptomyces sp. NPDC005931]|uniref:hypothetical protein n=1 Tax=Streptomyces sp. NPDC005931 TaxID=3364737 RepID=UPI00368121D4